MLLRTENGIEIWSDTLKKGTGRNFMIISVLAMFLSIVLFIEMKLDFSAVETYYFLGMFLFPCFIILICSFVIQKKETNKHLILKIDKDFLEIPSKKEIKKINTETITKLNLVNSVYGYFVVIFYTENNIEKKYSFSVSLANMNLVKTAIQEYRKNINICHY